MAKEQTAAEAEKKKIKEERQIENYYIAHSNGMNPHANAKGFIIS